MRRYVPLAIGLAIGLLIGAALLVHANPGYDGFTTTGDPYFELFVNEDLNHDNPPPAPQDLYTRIRFPLVDGWDGGGRPSGYQCAWAELFDLSDLNELAEVHIEIGPYLFDVQLNSKGMPNSPDPSCGDGDNNTLRPFTDSDHVPHGVTAIEFYRDGEPLMQNGQQVALDADNVAPNAAPWAGLPVLDICQRSYWVATDGPVGPGETIATLFWDEDGVTEPTQMGVQECPGGMGDTQPVASLTIRNADPDIGWCVVDRLGNSRCYNVEPPPTPVQLGSGRSVLTCPGGLTPAVESTEPLIVRC